MSLLARMKSGVATTVLRAMLAMERRSGTDLTELGWSPLGAALGVSPRRSVRKWLEAFGKNPRLYQAVNRLATDVSTVPWHLYRQEKATPDTVGQPKRTEVHEHPLKTLWDQPHPHFTGSQFRWLLQVWLDTVGEAPLLIDGSNPNRPAALWPVPPHWLTKVPSASEPWYEITFLARTKGGGYERRLESIPPEWVIFVHRPDPANPFGRGLGPCFALDDQVTLDEWMAKFNTSFFTNGAHPGVILGIEDLTDKNIKLIREQFESKHQGFMNAFRTAVLSKITAIHQVTPNHRDLEFVSGAKYNRDVIWQTFGLPPEIMGEVSNSNRATAQAADYIHQSKNILPRVTLLQEAFATWLVPLYGEPDLVLLPENPVKEADEFRLLKAEKMARSGVLTVNEYRREFGKPPLPPEIGDVLYVPVNNVQIIDARTGLARNLAGAATDPS